MALPLYLAMTVAEICRNRTMPQHMAYMACHFSPCGPGLTNLPIWLPEGAILVLDDRLPTGNQEPEICAAEVLALINQWDCAGLLLDFQRPTSPEEEAMVTALASTLPCPVAVTEGYAHLTQGPVLLPPLSPDMPLASRISPWQGRELWMDFAPASLCLILTEDGCERKEVSFPEKVVSFYDDSLCCHYAIQCNEQAVYFFLERGREELNALLNQAEELGISRALGLYREWKIPALS